MAEKTVLLSGCDCGCGCECELCPRLCDFRRKNRALYPDFFNAPVPPFGDKMAKLAVVGLAPGLKGANRTGRPFTGDAAGVLLYDTLRQFGWLEGEYKADINDGICLRGAYITNAVKCVPPQNKVLGAEVALCNSYLRKELAELSLLKVIVVLGTVAHNAALKALGVRAAGYPFAHGAVHKVGKFTIIDSYHCSRLNTNTGRLTDEMFKEVFRQAARLATQ